MVVGARGGGTRSTQTNMAAGISCKYRRIQVNGKMPGGGNVDVHVHVCIFVYMCVHVYIYICICICISANIYHIYNMYVLCIRMRQIDAEHSQQNQARGDKSERAQTHNRINKKDRNTPWIETENIPGIFAGNAFPLCLPTRTKISWRHCQFEDLDHLLQFMFRVPGHGCRDFLFAHLKFALGTSAL